MLGISVFISTLVGLMNFFQRPDKYTPFKDMVRKALSTYFDRLNRKFEPRGMEWYVQDNHYWLELRINSDKANQYRKNTNYDPRNEEASRVEKEDNKF